MQSTLCQSPHEGHAHELPVQPREQSASIRKEEENEMNAEVVSEYILQAIPEGEKQTVKRNKNGCESH